MADRKSEAEVPALITDPLELARAEARNALDQFDWAMAEVARWVKDGRPAVRVSMLLTLHRTAMQGIDQYAGNFRPAGVAIKGSHHVPVSGEDVARYVEEMLDYVNENWEAATALHLSAFVMWRLNWIHPFADGNGRTSRMLSYMVLCGRLGQVLPGTRTIPEQIAEFKKPYYEALEAADTAYKKGRVDVGAMERLLESYLANQLVTVHDLATGNSAKPMPHGGSTAETSKGPLTNWIESRPVIVGAIVTLLAAAIALGHALIND